MISYTAAQSPAVQQYDDDNEHEKLGTITLIWLFIDLNVVVLCQWEAHMLLKESKSESK